jgi:hypothetical protein
LPLFAVIVCRKFATVAAFSWHLLHHKNAAAINRGLGNAWLAPKTACRANQQKPVKPRSRKNSSMLVGQISATSLRHPGPQEGRFAVVMNVGPGCDGRGCVRDERADAYGKIVWS